MKNLENSNLEVKNIIEQINESKDKMKDAMNDSRLILNEIFN